MHNAYLRYPIDHGPIWDLDAWMLALSNKMLQEGLSIDAIPHNEFTIYSRKEELTWLLLADTTKYPFGISRPIGKHLSYEFCQEMNRHINRFEEHFYVLFADLQEHFFHFKSEFPGVNAHTFHATYMNWFNKYFSEVPTSQWGNVLRVYSEYHLINKKEQNLSDADDLARIRAMHTVFFKLWAYMKPPLPVKEISHTNAAFVDQQSSRHTNELTEDDIDSMYFNYSHMIA